MWKVMTSSNNWLIICQLHQNLFIFICRQTTFFLNQISKGCVGSIICKWSEWIFGPRHHQLIGMGCYDNSSSVSNSVHWRRVFYNLEAWSIISLCQHITQPSHRAHSFNPNPGFDVAIFNSNMSIQSVWTEPHQQISDLNRISNDLQMYFVPGLQQRHCMWFLAIC